MSDSQAILIVDLYGACRTLATIALKRGYKVFCLLSGAENTFQISDKKKTIYIQNNLKGFTKIPTEHFKNPLFQDDGTPSQELLCELQKYHFAAVIPGSEIGVTAAEEIAYALNLPTNTHDNLIARRDKFDMQETLAKAGIRSIRQQRIQTLEEAIAFFVKNDNKPIVLKPARGAGSEHVYICTSLEELESCFSILSQSKTFYGDSLSTMLIQEYIGGTEYICDFASRNGRHVLLAYLQYNMIELIDQKTNALLPVYDSVILKKHISQDVLVYAHSVLDALGITQGASHMEIKIDEHGPILIEVGARITGHLPTFSQFHEALGYDTSEIVLNSYMDEAAFDTFLQKPYKPLQSFLYYAFKSAHTVQVQELTAKTTLPFVPSLESFTFEMSEKTGIIPAVNNLMTIAGEAILLANTDEKVLQDYKTLKLLETTCSNLLWLPEGSKLSAFDKKVLASLKKTGHIDPALVSIVAAQGPVLSLKETNIATTFEQQASQVPLNTALTDYYQDKTKTLAIQSLSYEKLNLLANHVAVALVHHGILPGDCVAICMDKSIPRAIALLATLKAGAIATILPFGTPQARFLNQIKKTEAKLLISQSSLVNSFNQDIYTLGLDELLTENFQENDLELLQRRRVHPVAMKAFTTGTTGEPKVVHLYHKALLNTANYYQKGGGGAFDVYKFGPGLTKAVAAKESFVAWPAALLVSLISGVSVSFIHPEDCINPEQFISRARTLHVNLLWSAPAFVPSLMKQPLPDTLKLIECGGEGMAIKNHPKRPIIHLYGMTELFGVAAINYIDSPNIRGDMGSPIQNTRFYLLDDDMHPVKQGEIGQVCISGISLGNVPSALQQKGIVANPLYCSFTDSSCFTMMICTGDYAKLDQEGRLLYEGRKDSQVNINGQRISLQEIETVLDEIEMVQEHVVVPQKITKTATQLVAYVVLREPVDSRIIKQHIAQQLPAYYVPSHIIQLKKLPRNRHDKVSIKDLPLPNELTLTDTKLSHEASEQTLLFKELSRILGSSVTEQNAQVSFTDLGFDSFMIHELLASLGMHYPSLLLTYKDLITHNTPHKLQTLIDARRNPNNSALNSNQTKKKAAPIPSRDSVVTNQPNCTLKGSLVALPPAQAVLLDELISSRPSSKYTLSFMLPLPGVSLDHIKTFLTMLVQTQPALCSAFSFSGKTFEQQVTKSSSISQDILSRLTIHTFQNEQDLFAFAQKNVPILSFSKAPLFCPTVLSLDSSERPSNRNTTITGYLLFYAHHSIIDGSSIKLLSKLANMYFSNVLVALNDASKAFYDTFSYYQAYTQSTAYEKDVAYWNQYLTNFPSFKLASETNKQTAKLDLSSKAHAKRSKKITYTLSSKEVKKLTDCCKKGGYSISAALLGAFCNGCSQVFKTDRVSLVSPFNTRPTSTSELVIGMFAQTLPLSYEAPKKDASTKQYEEVLRHLDKTISNHALHQGGFSGSNTTILKDIDVMWNYLHMPPNNELSLLEMTELQKDFMLTAINTENAISFRAMFNPDAIQADMVEDVLHAMHATLRSLIKTSSRTSFETTEKKQTVADNASASSEKFYARLTETFSHYKNFKALTWYDEQGVLQSMTYQELEKRVDKEANDIKRTQAEYDIDPRYPLIISKALYHEVLISFLATFKLGIPALYVNPSQDEAYKRDIAKTISAPLIICDKEIVRNTFSLVELNKLYKGQSVLPLILLATSGSTGKPKIIPLMAYSLMSECYEEKIAYSLTHKDVIASLSNPSFDMFYLTLLPALFLGATCFVNAIDTHTTLDSIQARLEENKVTYAFMTTKLGEAYMEAFPSSQIKQLVVAGERLKRKPKTSYVVYNAYGPAEAGIVTRLQLEPQKTYLAQEITLGRPCNTMDVYVVKENDPSLLCKPGEKGEIALAGPQLIEGYLEERHTHSFIDNPFSNNPAYHKLFLTADLGYFNEEGELVFCGRKDSQIKINGVRINPHFVEDKALSLPFVSQAVAIAPKVHGVRGLLLFVVSKEKKGADEVLSELRHHLPEHLLPKRIYIIDSIPLTQTGKIDRKQLEHSFLHTGQVTTTDTNSSLQETYAINDSFYKQVIESYAELFNINASELSLDSNFFDLGGNSLLALMLSHSLKTKSGIDLSPAFILAHPEIHVQIHHIQNASSPSLLTNMAQSDEKRKLVFVHSGNTGAEAYKKLVNKLEKTYAVWCIEPYNRTHLENPLSTIEELASYYLGLLEKEGIPFRETVLAGWSFGGLIAYEMVLQAHKNGTAFKNLLLFDPVLPQTKKEKEIFRSLHKGETFLHYLKTSSLFKKAREKGLLDTLFQHGELVTEAILNYDLKPLHQPFLLFKAEEGKARTLFEISCFEKQTGATCVSLNTTHDELLLDEKTVAYIAKIIKELS